MYDQSSEKPISILSSEISMPPGGPRNLGREGVSEIVHSGNWALGDKRHAVGPLGLSLRKVMPMYTCPFLGIIDIVDDRHRYRIAQIGVN